MNCSECPGCRPVLPAAPSALPCRSSGDAPGGRDLGPCASFGCLGLVLNQTGRRALVTIPAPVRHRSPRAALGTHHPTAPLKDLTRSQQLGAYVGLNRRRAALGREGQQQGEGL